VGIVPWVNNLVVLLTTEQGHLRVEVQEGVFLLKRARAAWTRATPEVRVTRKGSAFDQCPPRCSPEAPRFASPSRRRRSELREARQLRRHPSKLNSTQGTDPDAAPGVRRHAQKLWRLVGRTGTAMAAARVRGGGGTAAALGHGNVWALTISKKKQTIIR
jgi:hypothetical protein